MSRINLLHLITELEPGGAENLLLHIIRRLDKGKFNVQVWYIYGAGTLAEGMREAGAKVCDLSRKGRIDPLLPFRLFVRIRREKIRVVHTHLVHASIVGRIAAKLAGVRSIITTRHYAKYQKEKSLVSWVERKTVAFNDGIIAVSDAVREHMVNRERCRPEKIRVIRNALDLGLFDSLVSGINSRRRGQFLLGAVGRLHPSKGYDILLRAIPLVTERFPRAKLMIAGNGREKHHLKQLCSQLRISNVVFFLGMKTSAEVKDLLGRINLFVMASNWEGLPIAVLEAMASGLPVVATNVGGLAEVVQHGQSGFLVPPGQPRVLAERINYLLENREVCAEMGKKGRRRVEALFSSQRMITELESTYQRLLHQRRV